MAIELKKPGSRTRGGKPGGGKGSPPETIYDTIDSDWDLLDIPLTQIDPNPFNKRDMKKLEETAEDIAANGLLTPVTVMHRDKFVEFYGERFPDQCAKLTKKYVLGPGERRWRASQLAETGTIKSILRNDRIPTIRVDLLRENFHREDPAPIEYARHIQDLSESDGLSYSEICDVLGIRSRGTITKYLQLLDLPEVLQDAVNVGTLTQKAAKVLGELQDEQDVVAALTLVTDREMTAANAVHQVRSAPQGVSPGNTDVEASTGAALEVEDPEQVDPGLSSDDAHAADGETAKPGRDERSQAPDKRAATATARKTSGKTSGKTTDGDAAERASAARDRERACIQWLEGNVLPTADQMRDLVVRALLVGGKSDGRTRAHSWLVVAGQAHFDIKDSEGYFNTVLSSDNEDLIMRATWAAALASNELRAADRRRPTWDRHDAAHVQCLHEMIGYRPTTSWEQTTLERLGVSLGNTSGAQNSEQESE